MTFAKCPACAGDQPDGLLCSACTARFRRDLTDLPDLVRELDVVLTRQTQIGSGNGVRRSAEIPLPYDQNASDVKANLVNTLTTWARELDLGDGNPPTPNIRGYCGWLLHRIERIRMHPAADEITDEIGYSVSIVRKVIDLPAPRVLAGPCPICERPVYGPEGAVNAVCKYCERAGIESIVDVDPGQAKRWQDAGGQLVTRTIALAALAHLSRPVKPETFRSWVKRGQVKRHPDPTSAGRVLYRLGDVLMLASTAKRKAS